MINQGAVEVEEYGFHVKYPLFNALVRAILWLYGSSLKCLQVNVSASLDFIMSIGTVNSQQNAKLEMRIERSVLVLVLEGNWLLRLERPQFSDVEAFCDSSSDTILTSLRVEGNTIGEWDTALLIFARKCRDFSTKNGFDCHFCHVPEGVERLVALSLAVPEVHAKPPVPQGSWFEHIGERTLRVCSGISRYCDFTGHLFLDVLAFILGRSQLRKRDFLKLLQTSGPQALGIVCLLSFLMGLIVAFVGVVQLEKFGAGIFVADLVGVAMTRELAPVMLGVIMAGRTGAAFAAQIGSMRVNEEVDALTCFGISPMQFLVLPRVFALILMMPLLCVCADFVSIVGGMVVAVGISNVTATQYIHQVEAAVALNDLFGGIFKSVVFGVIVAVAGCYRGLNCGKDASSVGLATTSAVVTAITWLVIADALFAVCFQILGI
jgi:phospholipid/cholesterol/gamma-HCH transport system permease protein